MDKLLKVAALLEKYWPLIEKYLPLVEAYLAKLDKTPVPDIQPPPPPPPPPPTPPVTDASSNFTGYSASIAASWSDEHRRQNEKEGRALDPEQRGPGFGDEASAEHVQAIIAGTEALWAGARLRLSADPMPNPSKGPSHPSWHVETPAGAVDFTLDEDGETAASGPGASFIWMIPRLFEVSRGCYITFRLLKGGPGELTFQLKTADGKSSNVVRVPKVAGH